MQIISKRTGKGYHFPKEECDAFLETGLFALPEVVPPPQRSPNSTWSVGCGIYNPEPILKVHCLSCNQSANFMGLTAHETQHFSHCGVNERAPKDVAKQYEELAREYHKKAARLPESRPAFLNQ